MGNSTQELTRRSSSSPCRRHACRREGVTSRQTDRTQLDSADMPQTGLTASAASAGLRHGFLELKLTCFLNGLTGFISLSVLFFSHWEEDIHTHCRWAVCPAFHLHFRSFCLWHEMEVPSDILFTTVPFSFHFLTHGNFHGYTPGPLSAPAYCLCSTACSDTHYTSHPFAFSPSCLPAFLPPYTLEVHTPCMPSPRFYTFLHFPDACFHFTPCSFCTACRCHIPLLCHTTAAWPIELSAPSSLHTFLCLYRHFGNTQAPGGFCISFRPPAFST